MLLNETVKYDDMTDTLHVIKKHDAQPVLDSVSKLKQIEQPKFSEKRHVGRVPFHILEQWINEAGVSFDDYEATREVIDRKLMSGEFNKLRIWEGNY